MAPGSLWTIVRERNVRLSTRSRSDLPSLVGFELSSSHAASRFVMASAGESPAWAACCFPKQQVCRKEDVAKPQLEPRYSAKKSMAYCAATMLPRASTDSSTL